MNISHLDDKAAIPGISAAIRLPTEAKETNDITSQISKLSFRGSNRLTFVKQHSRLEQYQFHDCYKEVML
uniref:Uncharacterized protein n=1 Tax=Octopus bimaculoides TaxID=37653 RepID=A0A0L8G4Y0_OCTBM